MITQDDMKAAMQLQDTANAAAREMGQQFIREWVDSAVRDGHPVPGVELTNAELWTIDRLFNLRASSVDGAVDLVNRSEVLVDCDLEIARWNGDVLYDNYRLMKRRNYWPGA